MDMIIKSEPVSMAEAKNIIEKSKDENKDILDHIKKFVKLSKKEAEDLKKEIENLNMLQIKPDHIVGIIDMLPEDISDLRKILVDSVLNEDESKKILEIVQKYR